MGCLRLAQPIEVVRTTGVKSNPKRRGRTIGSMNLKLEYSVFMEHRV